jgi:hypothetical protein
MPSTDNKFVLEDLTETEVDQMNFMCRRLGFDHYIIIGVDSSEFKKHVLSRGWHEEGAPKFGIKGSEAMMVYAISRLLTDFPFSENIRRGVLSVLNTIITGREIRKNINGRRSS